MDLRKEARRLDDEAGIALAAGDLDLARKLYTQATTLIGAADERDAARQRTRELVDTLPIEDVVRLGIKPPGPPSIRELARRLNYAQSTLSRALRGLDRIPYSLAQEIEKLRPDLPATSATWPKGWADETHHRSQKNR